MSLPQDVCRCAATYCLERSKCQRFTDQPTMPTEYLLYFCDFSTPHMSEPCSFFISEQP